MVDEDDLQVINCVEPMQNLIPKFYAVRVKYKYPGQRAGSLVFTFSRKADAEAKYKKMVEIDDEVHTATEMLVTELDWAVVKP